MFGVEFGEGIVFFLILVIVVCHRYCFSTSKVCLCIVLQFHMCMYSMRSMYIYILYYIYYVCVSFPCGSNCLQLISLKALGHMKQMLSPRHNNAFAKTEEKNLSPARHRDAVLTPSTSSKAQIPFSWPSDCLLHSWWACRTPTDSEVGEPADATADDVQNDVMLYIHIVT